MLLSDSLDRLLVAPVLDALDVRGYLAKVCRLGFEIQAHNVQFAQAFHTATWRTDVIVHKVTTEHYLEVGAHDVLTHVRFHQNPLFSGGSRPFSSKYAWSKSASALAGTIRTSPSKVTNQWKTSASYRWSSSWYHSFRLR
ncbi:hypothetical protein D3C87_1546560 [compost metagenome]